MKKNIPGFIKILIPLGIAIFLGYLSFPYVTQAPRVTTSCSSPIEINIGQPLPIAFSQLMNKNSVENNIHITPPTSFFSEWRGKTLFLEMNKKLKDGQIISININENAKNIIGRKIPKNTSIEFILRKKPEVIHIYPEGNIKNGESIYVTFSEEMIDQKNPIIQKTPTINPAIKGVWEWITPSTMRFSPQDNYNPSTEYRLTIPKGIKNISGIPTEEDITEVFYREQNEILYISEWYEGNNKPLEIIYTKPIQTSEINDFIKILEGNHILETIEIETIQKTENEFSIKVMPLEGWKQNTDYRVIAKSNPPEDKREISFTTSNYNQTIKDNIEGTEKKTDIKFALPHIFEISKEADQEDITIITHNTNNIFIEACEISERTLAVSITHELIQEIPFTKICKKYGSEEKEITDINKEESELKINISNIMQERNEKALYLLRATDVKTREKITKVIIPSEINIFAKKSPEDILVWIKNKEAQIRGYDMNGEIIFNENTNNNGMLYKNLSEPLSIIFAETENQISLLNTEWQKSIHPSEYGQKIILQEPSLDIFIVTDKNNYTIEDTIHIAGIVREKTASSLKIPENKTTYIAIRDAENFEIYRNKINIDNGFFQDDISLFEDTTKGKHTLITCIGQLGQYCEGTETYTYFYVGEEKMEEEKMEEENTSNKIENKSTLSIEFDKEKYQIGDEARLRFSYDKQGQALVTIEKQNLHYFQIIDIAPGFNATTLPITETLIPNAYASVVISNNNIYDIGYKEFYTEKESKKIKVEISTDKKKGEENKYVLNIKTRNYQNKSIPTKTIILFAEENENIQKTNIEEEILNYFFSNTGLGVINTSNTVREENYTFAEESLKIGKSSESFIINTNQKIVDWMANIETDENGEINYVADLPSGKTIIAYVLAVSDKTEIGFSQISIDTRDIITTEDYIPKIIYAGDQFFINPIITNKTNESNMTINIETNALKVIGPNEIKITIQPEKREQIRFHLEAPSVTKTISEEITITVKTKNSLKQENIKLLILPTGKTEKIHIIGELANQSIKELLPNIENSKNEKIDIYVGTSKLAFVMNNIEELLSKKIGTNEEVTSRILSLATIIETFDSKSFQDLSLPPLRSSMDEEISAEDIIKNGIEIITQSQNQDGGWSRWNNQSASQSDISTSAYILASLGRIKRAGFSINNTTYNKAYNFITKKLYALDENEKDTVAYLLATLSEINRYEIGSMQKLMNEKDDLSSGGKIYLARALNKAGFKEISKKIMDEILEKIHTSEKGSRIYADKIESPMLMMSDIKRTALLIMAMEEISPEHKLTDKMTQWITSQSTNNTLHEQAHVIQAVVSTIENQDDNRELNTEIIFNNKQKNSIRKNVDSRIANERISISKYINQSPYFNELTIIAKGTHPLFYCITSFFLKPANIIQASSKGIGIVRNYSNAKTDEIIKTAEINEKITGTLTIIIPQQSYNLEIKDPLPGGVKFIKLLTEKNDQLQLTKIENNILTIKSEKLEPGVYTYKYLVETIIPGKFFHAPAEIHEQYNKQKRGNTLPSWLTIKNP